MTAAILNLLQQVKTKTHSLVRAGMVVVFALLLIDAAAAQHGQIRGTVTDASTGETLPGVNVVIEGTTQGAATDLNGQYVIIGVRPDTYNVLFSFIGYQSVRVEEVRVRIDLSTTIDIQLREEVFEGDEIVVTAVRELVQRDLTATTAIISADEIRALPVENFHDIVNLQAGVVNGHFRGGRRGEVGYWIDGMPVQDVFDGGLALGIENSMVQEAQVVSGAFNAEFGQAMSGIVNVVTKDGSNDFEGSFYGFTGDYFTGESRLPTGQEVFPELDGFSPASVRNAELSLGGPVLRNRLFFFTSGRYFNNDGWIFGRDVFRATGAGDSSAVALNPYERMSGHAKLTAQLGRGMRLAANVIASREDSKEFDFARFFFPTSQLNNRRESYSSYLKLTHSLSSRTFYEAGITNNFSRFRQHLFDDPMDPRYMPNDLFEHTQPNHTSHFRTVGTDNRRFFRSTNTWLFKADLSSQINHQNLVKVGIEGRYHTIDFRDRMVVVDGEQFLADFGTYRRNPVELSAYAQDKIELGDLIINVGLRVDYFDPAAPVFRDPNDPNAVFLENRLILRDENGNPILDQNGRPIQRTLADGSPDYLPADFFTSGSPKWQLSPRIGVAFPITAGGVVHFSYGHFFQRPAFERLYQNPYFLLSSGGSGLIGLVGNANLHAEQTISGEIGLKQQLTENSAVEVTAYYRDIRNLTGTALEPLRIHGSGARYGQLGNSDFGFVRGFIVRYDQRFGGDYYAGFDYTFQVARANSSDPSQEMSAAAALGLVERRILPTDWDQLHTITFSLAYTNPEIDGGIGMIASYGSGSPYTPSQVSTGGADLGPGRILLNSATKPSVFNVNLSAHKNFRLFEGHEVQVFSQLDNLLDTRNEVDVFSETGTATYSLHRNFDAATFLGDRAFLDRWYTRPGFFSQPRRVVFGLRYSF
jgi:hypothetical protein